MQKQFIPSKSKYKKYQKGKSIRRIHKKNNFFRLTSGSIALKSASFGRLSSKEIKTLVYCINKIMKKRGCLILHIFPQTPITKKPLEIRMGKGKGSVDHWIYKIKPGMILLEIQTNFSALALKALKLVKIRLKIKSQIIFN